MCEILNKLFINGLMGYFLPSFYSFENYDKKILHWDLVCEQVLSWISSHGMLPNNN